MTITFRPGLLPNDPSRARLHLSPYLTGAPIPVPAAANWDAKVPSWPMYGNDSWGDCVWAMIGHAIQTWSANAGVEVTVPVASLLKGYSDVTGFDPAAGPPGSNPTDNGTVIQDALDYWRKTGIVAADGSVHKILAFAQVNISNPAELEAAVDLFGDALFGINFPASAMDQFNAGQPWDVVAGSAIEGGHAICSGRYGVSGAVLWEIITWAKAQGMTDAFRARYLSEAWVAISPEWVEANGLTPTGLNLQALGHDFSVLTGAPNPFPAPTPPAPPAFPGTLVAAVQAAAADPTVSKWIGGHHLLTADKDVAAHLTAILAAPRA